MGNVSLVKTIYEERMAGFSPRLFCASSSVQAETTEHHGGDSASEESGLEALHSEYIEENTSESDNSEDEIDVEERGLLPREREREADMAHAVEIAPGPRYKELLVQVVDHGFSLLEEEEEQGVGQLNLKIHLKEMMICP